MQKQPKILYVSDFFYPQFTGGAEMTSDALLRVAPKNVQVIQMRACMVTRATIEQFKNYFWLFGNFAQLNFNLLDEIQSRLNYAVLEYDFKFCVYQSPERHHSLELRDCDCEHTFGKRIAAFYRNAKIIFFMSKRQQDIYHARFPGIQETEQMVLSSVFSVESINLMRSLREKKNGLLGRLFAGNKYILLKSDSWIKGYPESVKYCQENGIAFEAVSKLTYTELLKKLARSKGLIFRPLGGDSCPRLVIEAKLLGKDLILNDNVLHKDEEWFNGSIAHAEEYLQTRPIIFWNKIKDCIYG